MKQSLGYFLITICLALVLNGCTIKNSGENSLVTTSAFTLATVETTEAANNSVINFFDKTGKQVHSFDLKYGGIGNIYLPPLSVSSATYMVSTGKNKNGTNVIELNKKDFSYKAYDTDQPNIQSLEVHEKEIFTTNTMNGSTKVQKYNKDTKGKNSLELSDIFIGKLYYYENFLWAFGKSMDEENTPYLFQINSEMMTVLEKFDLSEIGDGQEGVVGKGNFLYFTNQYQAKTEGQQTSNKLTKFDLKTKQYHLIELEEESPFQLKLLGKTLYISHFDPVLMTGNKVTILDLENESQKLYEIDTSPQQIEIQDQSLLVLGNDKVSTYEIKTFKKQSEISLNKKINKTGYSYFSGMFVN